MEDEKNNIEQKLAEKTTNTQQTTNSNIDLKDVEQLISDNFDDSMVPKEAYPILDAILVGLFWKDLKGRYIACNQTIWKRYGFTHRQEMIGKTDAQLPKIIFSSALIEK